MYTEGITDNLNNMKNKCLVCHNEITNSIKIADIHPDGFRNWTEKKFADYYIAGANNLMHKNTFDTYSQDTLCGTCVEKLEDAYRGQ
jgi:hypothetical protein